MSNRKFTTPADYDDIPWQKLTRDQTATDQQRPALLKRMACEGVTLPDDPTYNDEWLKYANTIIAAAPIIAVDAAAKSFMERWDDGKHKPSEVFDGILALPFPFLWMETGWAKSKENLPDLRAGTLMTTLSATEESIWVGCFGAIGVAGRRPQFPAFMAKWELDRQGQLIPGHIAGYQLTGDRIGPDDDGAVMQTLFPFLACLTLLNCKNVGMDDHDVDENTDTRMRRRFGERKELSNRYRFHTLSIQPMRSGRRSNSDGAPTSTGMMGLHIVRGHVARYGEQFGRKLLFGKYSGQFLISPHVRGNAKNGVVGKSYILDAPPAQEGVK